MMVNCILDSVTIPSRSLRGNSKTTGIINFGIITINCILDSVTIPSRSLRGNSKTTGIY